MFVVYVAPWFSEFSLQGVRAAVELPGVRVGLISQDPWEALPPDLREQTVAHWRVDDVLDAGQLLQAAIKLGEWQGTIHRLFTGIEHLQVQLAEVRQALGIPGMSVEATLNFRDKARMKRVLHAAGLPAARFHQAESDDDAWQFVSEIGFPVVVKPLAGAGSQTTFHVAHPEQFAQAIGELRPTPGEPAMIEEFIQGDEHSFETFSLDGRPLWTSLTHYYPNPLDVIRNPWIQWMVLLPREVDAPQYDDIRQLNFAALEALGMDTGITHMEWFRRFDGSIAISEVAARPPGAQITTLMSIANEFDCIATWIRLMILGEFDPPERKYAAGAAYLRAQGRGGRIRAIHGLDEAARELSPLVFEARIPEVGQSPTGRYEGDGYVILRHPDTEMVRQGLERLVSLVRVELG